MRPSPFALCLFFATSSLHADELAIVGELARVGGTGELKLQSLATGAPLSLVSVGPHVVNVWLGPGAPEPVVSPLPHRKFVPRDFAFADFDGDGFLDLAVGGPEGIDVLKGDGLGRFDLAASLQISGGAGDVAAADADGDGKPDLLAVGSFNTIRCFLARGGFQFDAPRDTAITTFGGAGTVSAADVDGDTRADVALSGMYRGQPSIWASRGDGTFRLLDSSFVGYQPGPVLFADLLGNGRADLVYSDRLGFGPGGPISVYANDGSGGFHSAGGVSANYGHAPLSAVDVDRDGRLEVVYLDRDLHPFLSFFRPGAPGLPGRYDIPRYSPLESTDGFATDGATFYLSTPTGVVVLAQAPQPRTDVVVVPVLVSTTGLFGSRFDSDLLLTNSGSTAVHLVLRYAAAAGGGSGIVERDLLPGAQLYAPSAISFLRDAGLPIGDGNAIGTLRVETTGASSPRAVSALVRTTSPSGAGVSYGGVPGVALLRGASVVPWLKEDARDRSNLALVNAGAAAEGAITLRATVFSGEAGAEPPVTLPDVVLEPGGFLQIGRVLRAAGLAASVGWARVERVAGVAPYLAWAAVNDAGTSDGSFEPATEEITGAYTTVSVPNAVQTTRYTTEFVATNPGPLPSILTVRIGPFGGPTFKQEVAAGETYFIPDLFAEFRRRGVVGAPAAGANAVAPLTLEADAFFAAGVRVSSTPEPGRWFGVFEPATHVDVSDAIVLPSLRQDQAFRTNVGISLTGGYPVGFRLDVFDASGRLAGTKDDIHVPADGVLQLDSVLRDVAPGLTRGWARLTTSSPYVYWPSAFSAYAVTNDGATPGAGTDDGSFVAGIPD
jgi:hypothetical protein